MRTSFAAKLPPVVADERSVKQIVLNLVSNAIKFTDAGGQVIVSTALTDRGEVAFRVRDTGIGMTEEEIEAALEPFRQLATARKRGGTGLGLPLTKALVEANRGALQISLEPERGHPRRGAVPATPGRLRACSPRDGVGPPPSAMKARTITRRPGVRRSDPQGPHLDRPMRVHASAVFAASAMRCRADGRIALRPRSPYLRPIERGDPMQLA